MRGCWAPRRVPGVSGIPTSRGSLTMSSLSRTRRPRAPSRGPRSPAQRLGCPAAFSAARDRRSEHRDEGDRHEAAGPRGYRHFPSFARGPRLGRLSSPGPMLTPASEARASPVGGASAAFTKSPGWTCTAIQSLPWPAVTCETATCRAILAPSIRTGPWVTGGNSMVCCTLTGIWIVGNWSVMLRRTRRATSSRADPLKIWLMPVASLMPM